MLLLPLRTTAAYSCAALAASQPCSSSRRAVTRSACRPRMHSRFCRRQVHAGIGVQVRLA